MIRKGSKVTFVLGETNPRSVEASVTHVHEDGFLDLRFIHPDGAVGVEVEHVAGSDRAHPGYWIRPAEAPVVDAAVTGGAAG